MDDITLDYTYESTKNFVYAGFWQRVLAVMIDGILLNVIWYFLAKILGIGLEAGYVSSGVPGVLTWLYFSLMESSDMQATLGKQALGLKVCDEQGMRISFLKATGRHFAKFLSAIILFIGFIMVAFDEKKQGLHDKLARTLVVLR